MAKISKPSLAEVSPDLAAQAHGWDPTTVTFKSNQKKSWVCDFGHVWDAVVSHRTRGQGCPFCSGHRVIVGVNDLSTTHPLVSQQAFGWDPTTVKAGSKTRFEWICSNEHRWTAAVGDRAIRGTGCKFG